MPAVDVTAGRIHYDEHSPGVSAGEGAPTVVLLHGLVMNRTVWDPVLPLLPAGYRYIRPDLPLGAHREPMRPGADLALRGQAGVVADLLEALDLHDVTLVHSDWGGALFLTAYGLDERVGRIVVLPSEAFDNFPPGLPGRMVSLATKMPGGIRFALRQLRIPWLRRLPPLFGHMTRVGIPDDVMRDWTEPALTDAGVHRDLLAYATSTFDKAELIAHTEALRGFTGDALVLWSSAGKVMPHEHGRRLADLLPRGRLVELDDCYVLAQLDRPDAVAAAIGEFLATSSPHRP